MIPDQALTFSELLKVVDFKYTDTAALAILVWDYLLTFQSEIDLIWRSHWSIVKILFLLTRYMPAVDVTLVIRYQFASSLSEHDCRILYDVAGWIIMAGITVAELILLYRTWALWGGSRRMGIILILLGIGLTISSSYVEYLFLRGTEFVMRQPPLPSCIVSSKHGVLAISFVFIIATETVVLTLTLAKYAQHYRSHTKSTILNVLFRDGVLFYCYLLGFSILNLAFILTASKDAADALIVLQRVLHSSFSARILLNLREAQQLEGLSCLSTSPFASNFEEPFSYLTSVQSSTSEFFFESQ